MCGIAGLIGIDPNRAAPAARRMLAALRHRGPDDEGIEVVNGPAGAGPPAVLVHTRLALLDLLAAGPELVPPVVRPSALESYLAQGAVWGPEALVAGVELLEPGQSLWADWSGKPERRVIYWRIPFAPAEPAAPADAGRAGEQL